MERHGSFYPRESGASGNSDVGLHMPIAGVPLARLNRKPCPHADTRGKQTRTIETSE